MFDIFEKLILRTLLFREMMFMLRCFVKYSQSITKFNIRREFIKTLHFSLHPGRRGQKLFPVLKLPGSELTNKYHYRQIYEIRVTGSGETFEMAARTEQNIHDECLHRGVATDQSEIEIYR